MRSRLRFFFITALALALFSEHRILTDNLKGIASPAKLEVSERKSFTELLVESKSDKYSKHHYEKYYEKWLAPYRETRGLKLLEIGANEGHSLNLWSNYFDKEPEIIVGLAYGNAETIVREGTFTAEEGKAKVTVIEGDQSSPDTIRKLIGMGPWDVIIDDGSHVPQHVLGTLFSLWSTIRNGGMYIIEDIETSYWKQGREIYGYKLIGTGFLSDSKHSTVYKLKEILDILARYQLGIDQSKSSVMPGDDSICSIEWGMNIVALKKCSAEEEERKPEMSKKKWYSSDNFEEWKKSVLSTNPH